MSTSKLVSVAAGVVAVLALTAVASFALTTPTLTASASLADAKIKVAGIFTPVNAGDCGDRNGKTITMLLDDVASGTDVTHGTGLYQIQSDKMNAGSYIVKASFPGILSATYPFPVVCNAVTITAENSPIVVP